MRAWFDIDEFGERYLTRVGTGLVLSVTPIRSFGTVTSLTGSFGKGPATEADSLFHRIAILVDGVCSSSPAIRFQASAIVAADDPIFAIAMEAIDDDEVYSFSIQWHSHEYLPRDLPIEALDLALDTHGILVELIPMRDQVHSIPNAIPCE